MHIASAGLQLPLRFLFIHTIEELICEIIESVNKIEFSFNNFWILHNNSSRDFTGLKKIELKWIELNRIESNRITDYFLRSS